MWISKSGIVKKRFKYLILPLCQYSVIIISVMKNKKNSKYLPLIIAGIFSVIMIIGIILIIGTIFGGSNKSRNNNKKQNNTQEDLSGYFKNPTKDSTVRMTVRGPVTALEKHYDIDLKISSSHRSVYVYKGYENKKVAKKIELNNDMGAYKDFMQSLYNNGYTLTAESKIKKNRGLCADGQIVTFYLYNKDKVVHESWTTSCKGESGTFAGQTTSVIDLLLRTIPNAQEDIAEVQEELSN